jgi:intraflagellar transport protein 46
MQFKPQGRFPAFDTLMQTWPEELEPLVRSLRRPEGDIDVSTDLLVRAVCGLLDIPVYEDLVDCLHHVFMLYLEMKNNEVINQPDAGGMGPTGHLNFVSLN